MFSCDILQVGDGNGAHFYLLGMGEKKSMMGIDLLASPAISTAARWPLAAAAVLLTGWLTCDRAKTKSVARFLSSDRTNNSNKEK